MKTVFTVLMNEVNIKIHSLTITNVIFIFRSYKRVKSRQVGTICVKFLPHSVWLVFVKELMGTRSLHVDYILSDICFCDWSWNGINNVDNFWDTGQIKYIKSRRITNYTEAYPFVWPSALAWVYASVRRGAQPHMRRFTFALSFSCLVAFHFGIENLVLIFFRREGNELWLHTPTIKDKIIGGITCSWTMQNLRSKSWKLNLIHAQSWLRLCLYR